MRLVPGLHLFVNSPSPGWIDLIQGKYTPQPPAWSSRRVDSRVSSHEPVLTQGQVELPSDVRPPSSGMGGRSERTGASGLFLPGQSASGQLSVSRSSGALLIPGQTASAQGGSSGVELGARGSFSPNRSRGSDSTAAESGDPEVSGSGLVVSSVTRQAARWSEIQRRWRQLPLERRLSVLQLAHLPASRLASLCVKSREMGWPDMFPHHVRRVLVRPDADSEVLSLLQNWEWVNDGTTVEFRLRGVTLSPRELLRNSASQ